MDSGNPEIKPRLEPIDPDTLPIPIPPWTRIVRKGKYLSILGAHDHPIAGLLGRIPYHRYVLHEKLGRPSSSECHWCGFPLPWKSSLYGYSSHSINADHVDGDTSNNHPSNLVASCWWCNANRSWAQKYEAFWSQWRRWMKDVPPASRPNLIAIGKELGLDTPSPETSDCSKTSSITEFRD